jgi:protein O-GlcNAc transferase
MPAVAGEPRIGKGQVGLLNRAIMKKYDYIEADDYYDMALGWIRSGNYEKGENYLHRTIELNPNFVYAYIALGRVLALKKKFSDAVHALKRATHIDPAFDRLYFLMSKYAYKNGDYKNALIYIDKALAIDRKTLYVITKEYIEER